MRPGRLDKRITIQARTVTPGRMGTGSEAWADSFTCWANVAELAAKERNAAPKVMAVRSATFMIRWRDDVAESSRIVYDGANWNITGIRQIGRKESLEIAAEVVEVTP